MSEIGTTRVRLLADLLSAPNSAVAVHLEEAHPRFDGQQGENECVGGYLAVGSLDRIKQLPGCWRQLGDLLPGEVRNPLGPDDVQILEAHGDSFVSRRPESPDGTTVGTPRRPRGAGLDPAALDAVAIILTEIEDLLAEPTVASSKVATILAAAEDLDRFAGTMSSPSVTHVNGVLIDRYAAAREALR